MGDKTFFSDDEGIGKFLAYVKDQELEAEDIKEELYDNDAEDCAYAEFDSDFPYPQHLKKANEEDKLTEMIKILQSCYENVTPPAGTQSKLLEEIQLNVEDATMTKCKELYSKQCEIMLGSDGLGDGTLMYFFGVGMQNKYSAFLLNMCDSFMRDRIIKKNHGSIINDYTAEQWLQDNKQVKAWVKAHPRANKLGSAIKSYVTRISPKLQLKPLNKIDDSLEQIVQRIIAICEFVGMLLKAESTTPPFQLDFSIAVRGVTSNGMDMAAIGDADDDDYDSDGDDDDDDEKESVNPELGNVLNNIVKAKLAFKNLDLNPKEQFEFKARNIYSIFRDYKKGKKNEMFPERRRVCGFIDRRNVDKKKENIIFYDPPGEKQKFNDIPREHVAEWYFGGAREALLPLKSNQTGAANGMKGAVITLSFHVEARDEVKCYFYWNGQVFRFYPQDIMDVLPIIFNEKYAENMKYIKSQDIREDAKKITVIRDSKFERLYKGMKNDKNNKFPVIQ